MKFLSDIDTAARIKNVPAGTIAATTVQGAINELDDTIQALSASATAATKTGTASFPGGGTTDVVTDAFITVDTFVVVSPTGTKVGEWTVEAAAGSFTVTSDSTEAATATYDWGAFLDGTAATPSPVWRGVIVGCAGDGNPNTLLTQACAGTIIPMTPTLLTISLARISYFKLDTAITFNKVRFFGIGVTTNIYQLAIYNADTLARIWTSGTFSTASQTWGSIGSAINITLAANQLYFIAVSVNTTGTTAGILCFGATTTRIGVLPKNWPGSLDVDANIVYPPSAQGQFAVTTGALVNPANTIAALGTMACGFPAIFLDSNNA